MSVTIGHGFFLKFWDPFNPGQPLVGGKLFIYQAGTSTKIDTWTDSTQIVKNDNPIILDARGECSVWGDVNLPVKYILSPPNDSDPPQSPIDVMDNVEFAITKSVLTQQVLTSILYPVTPAETAVNAVVTSNVYPAGNILRYGADPFGLNDSSTAIQTAIQVANNDNRCVVFVPAGRFVCQVALHMRDNVTITGTGYNSIIAWPNGFNGSDNLLKFESISYATASNLRLDGNRSSVAGGTQYGIYFGGAFNCSVTGCWTNSHNGDGIHIYNSDNCTVSYCYSWDNFFHGLEFEACRNCSAIGNHCYSNLRNGVFVYLGLLGQGCKYCVFTGNICGNNVQNGIDVQGSANEGIIVSGNIVEGNGAYGILLFDGVRTCQVTSNTVSFNQLTGIYIWKSQYNTISNNSMHNNGQQANAGFQEIHIDSDFATSGVASKYNIITGNMILIDGAIKCAYAIKENTVNDGPNVIRDNIVPFNGSAGNIAYLCEIVNGFTGPQLLVPNSFSLGRGNLAGRSDEFGGVQAFSGNGVQKIFKINHLLFPDEPRIALVGAGSTDAIGPFWFFSDSNFITVTFATAPPVGTNNIAFRWYAAI